jgi:AAA family ATP:ADP antiporter
MTASDYLPVGLMLIGAAFFAASIVLMLILDRVAVRSGNSRLGGNQAAGASRSEVIGGRAVDGLIAVASSPYLLGIAAFIVAMAISNTMIYFAQANIILEATDTFSNRVGSFAQFDMLAQIATLITQLFVTTHLIRRLGVGMTLAVLPLVTLIGFGVLAIWPLYGVMAIFQALQRATRYAISRPSRETLFSVLRRHRSTRPSQ